MKTLQKLILPVLLILFVFVIYKFYFAADTGLGSFSDFDPNNSAVKEIRVLLLKDRGINRQGSEVVFYASDKNGKVMMVSGAVMLPQGFQDAETIILKGHLSGNSFHVHEVLID